MGNQSFGLLNKISAIINEGNGDNDAAIARYLVSNIRKSDAINVSAITERAHVTRSAVRRFCNRLGYQSLRELKDSCSQLMFPSDIRHRDPNLSFHDYRAALDVRIIEMYAEIESRVSDELLSELSRELARHQTVEILCSNNTSGNLVRFQQEMFFAGKIIQLSTEARVRSPHAVETLNDSLAIVVSVSGMFARELDDCFWNRSAKKVLITAFSNQQTAAKFDRAYYLGDGKDGIDTFGIYSKYGVTYLFDLLSSYYIATFATRGTPFFGPSATWPE